MAKRYTILAVAALITAGCTARSPENVEEALQPDAIPPQVLAIAGPNQDLSTAEFEPSDGCYWYYHAGQVETTRVPLRAANGNQICNAPSV
ncbi:hypothetical protein [Paracoccus aerodenitrificans]|uniref:hypothetical protein n=1 Tax=Paracoccus aerodenitrificans TaxID=3017781 RepID=UPI0022F1269B|nr:hypothetical protein [Paracoccus aerodenitrificans]WBU65202.1 hypothetical protein PAE61_07185 [Paracoccus aerodenitrificans]